MKEAQILWILEKIAFLVLGDFTIEQWLKYIRRNIQYNSVIQFRFIGVSAVKYVVCSKHRNSSFT